MKRSPKTISAITLFLVLSLSACGGGGARETSTLTQVQLIERGDRICAQVDREQTAGFGRISRERTDVAQTKAGQEQLVLEAGLPPVRKAIEKLKALGAPDGDEETVAAIIEAMEEAVEAAEEEPARLFEGSGENPFLESDARAREYGFRACADML